MTHLHESLHGAIRRKRFWSRHGPKFKMFRISVVQSRTSREPKTSPSMQRRSSKPGPRPSDPLSSVHHNLESGCLPPANNMHGPGINLGSMFQTCSSSGLSKTPSMPFSDPLSTAKTNGQPLSEPLGLEAIDPVAPPNPNAFKEKQGAHKSKGLKSSVGGLTSFSMSPRRRFRCDTEFWCQRWKQWGHQKWRRARCFLLPYVFKAKQRAKGRSRTLLQNHSGKVQGSHLWKSPGVEERELAQATGCDGVEAPEDRPAEECSDQRCLSFAASDPLPHQGMTRDEAKQAKGLGTKGVVLSQSQQPAIDVSSESIAKLIHTFLDGFRGKYGSFIPLTRIIIISHLREMLNIDLSKRRSFIFAEVARHQAVLARRPLPSFRVVYNKHSLTLEDLSTLDDQNWLNDQVMNMYGELIMESAHHKVHFFNSFFYQQLVTKGYEGVRRWTKKVDLFSKTLLLVPIHLEIHWCLMTVDVANKKIDLYDSQGMMFKEAAQDILKYVKNEAQEKKRTAFQSDWTVFVNEGIPQQTNENDCGVFVLEYCRCLALGKPLHFSQGDMPRVRKRIYRELCDCQLDT